MKLAFALNSYNKTKISNNNDKYDGYEAVKFALSRAIEGMEKLREEMPSEQKEKYFEQALTSIYFLQKCLDFEKGGELAKNLFKVYEFCRQQIITGSKHESYSPVWTMRLNLQKLSLRAGMAFALRYSCRVDFSAPVFF